MFIHLPSIPSISHPTILHHRRHPRAIESPNDHVTLILAPKLHASIFRSDNRVHGITIRRRVEYYHGVGIGWAGICDRYGCICSFSEMGTGLASVGRCKFLVVQRSKRLLSRRGALGWRMERYAVSGCGCEEWLKYEEGGKSDLKPHDSNLN